MPLVDPPSSILVTGANGFIASWLCRELLTQGFRVKGTVRKKEKGDYLSKLFEEFGNKFSYIVVEDFLQPGIFDEAVDGVEGIAHTASPIHLDVRDPYNDFVNPAINGTLSVLKSAKKNKGVKRVLILSSYATIENPKEEDPEYVFTEKDWNEYSPKLLAKLGKNTPLVDVYCASKVLAEKSAWKFMEDEKPTFDLVSICPPLVWGPIIHDVKHCEHLNVTLRFFYEYLNSGTILQAAARIGHLVDVRDIAKIHLECFLREGAGGNRYISGKAPFTFQSWIDITQADEFSRKNWPNAAKELPSDIVEIRHNSCDPSKSERDLGVNYRPLETLVMDTSRSLKEISKAWN